MTPGWPGGPGWPRTLAGGVALGALLALTLGPVAAVASFAGGWPRLGAADLAALRFTLWQATLSAALSVALAIPLARALARRRFPGRGLLVALLGAPFILPVIVAVFGLLAIWGRAGLLNSLGAALGLPEFSIYGPAGVILAHVFFNLPLATRLILQGWASVPGEHFRLAANLAIEGRAFLRLIEWPILRAVLPGAFLVIFLLCLTSFAVVLTLGGGPRATTLELAIFQALRFDFDLAHAAALALVQVALCLGVAALLLGTAGRAEFSMGLDLPPLRWDGRSPLARAGDAAAIALATGFLLTPLVAVLLRGLGGLAALPAGTWAALGTTLAIALPSALLSTALALALAALLLRLPGAAAKGIEGLSTLALAISPFVLGTGLFILLNPVIDPFAMAIPVTVAVNAVMALPFGLRILLPALARAEQHYLRLAHSVGMRGLTAWRLALLPRLHRALGFATGLAAAISVGDLGVITLFAPPDLATLPLLMYRLMGAYRMEAAAGVALVMLVTAFALFWAFDRGGRVDDHLR